jgi:hypothetical protein
MFILVSRMRGGFPLFFPPARGLFPVVDVSFLHPLDEERCGALSELPLCSGASCVLKGNVFKPVSHLIGQGLKPVAFKLWVN